MFDKYANWYFSIIDVVEVLVENNNRPRKYWSDLKQKLDSMGKLELAITNLAEVTANEMHNTNNSFGCEMIFLVLEKVEVAICNL